MSRPKINLIAADMGYGHFRAAYPLIDIAANNKIVSINNYEGIPEWEKKYWEKSLKSYEKISRLKKIPLFGSLVFAAMDAFQKIDAFYPNRDLSKPTTQEKFFYRMINKGLGKDLVNKLNNSNLPYLTTFFVAAYSAEAHKYKGLIYCVVCDTDASRAWANLNSEETRVIYLLPSEKVKERFMMYGVPEKNLIVTGFPLPKENIGENKEILKRDLSARLSLLDPRGIYFEKYSAVVKNYLPEEQNVTRPLTITYAVGGAGAQKETGLIILKKLKDKIISGKLAVNLVAGNRPEIKEYFDFGIKDLGLDANSNVRVIFDIDKINYFKKFNQVLRTSDILWTKPSELSFYCALGLPIIISEPVGSQEDFNHEWLIGLGAGIDSPNPEYVAEWLPDLLESGRLARAAMDGFLNAEVMGTYNIDKIFDK
ncbi:MAG: hypothetical protein WCK59_00300 [Candidatus Falkowbacteria bacterium]